MISERLNINTHPYNQKVLKRPTPRKIKRSEPIIPRIKSFFVKLFKILMICLYVGIFSLLVYTLFYFLFISEFFNLKEVEVLGVNEVLSNDIKNIAGLNSEEKVNVLKLSQKMLLTKLSSHPKLYNISINKKPPDKLVVYAEERLPYVIVNSGNMYLVDKEGYVIEKITFVKDYLDIPFVTGINQNLNIGDQIDDQNFRNVLNFLMCLEDKNTKIFKTISEMNISEKGEITAFFRGGTKLQLGVGNATDKLATFELFLKKVSTLDNVKYIDLRFNNQIVYQPKTEN